MEMGSLSGYKVLVVDDNDFVRLMVRKFLGEFGFKEVYEAANGEDGIKLLEKKPDIVICDINMEPLNGFEFLQHVRQQKAPTGKLPVIFLTSNANAEYVQNAVDLSVDAYLLKPVTADNLKAKIMSLLSRV